MGQKAKAEDKQIEGMPRLRIQVWSYKLKENGEIERCALIHEQWINNVNDRKISKLQGYGVNGQTLYDIKKKKLAFAQYDSRLVVFEIVDVGHKDYREKNG